MIDMKRLKAAWMVLRGEWTANPPVSITITVDSARLAREIGGTRW